MEPVIVRFAQSRSLETLLRSAPAVGSVLLPVSKFTIPPDLKPKVSSLDPEQFPKVVGLLSELKKVPGLEDIEVLGLALAPLDTWLQYTARNAQGNFVSALRCSKDLGVILNGVAAALSATGRPMAGLAATADVLGILVKTVDGVYEIIRVVREGKV